LSIFTHFTCYRGSQIARETTHFISRAAPVDNVTHSVTCLVNRSIYNLLLHALSIRWDVVSTEICDGFSLKHKLKTYPYMGENPSGSILSSRILENYLLFNSNMWYTILFRKLSSLRRHNRPRSRNILYNFTGIKTDKISTKCQICNSCTICHTDSIKHAILLFLLWNDSQ